MIITITKKFIRILGGAAGLLTLLASCASPPTDETDREVTPARQLAISSSAGPAFTTGVTPDTGMPYTEGPPAPSAFLVKGSGNFIGRNGAGSENTSDFPADVTLNFNAADLREVAKVIFEDILKENYLIHPNVRGIVTIKTILPVKRDAVVPILESLLQLNGAALVRDRDIYKVVPLAQVNETFTSPTVGRRPASPGAGFGMQVVPLKHVSATAIKKILDSFASTATTVQVDAARNLVLLSGPRNSVNNLLETIEIFDVNWFAGMSFGLFPLDYADAKVLTGELLEIVDLGGEGAWTGVVRLIPIERLNAILVVTHQPEHLDTVRALIEQFDRGTQAGPARRLHIYNLKNAKADDIAEVLQELFGGGQPEESAIRSADLPPSLRPNVRPVTISSVPPPPQPGPGGMSEGALQSTLEPPSDPNAGAAVATGTPQGAVMIRADQRNNSILVLASLADYRSVEAAIRKLDTAPRQVLIEATIAEVQLSDNLSYGVRWFFEWGLGSYGIETAFRTPLPGGAGGEGLTLALFNSDDEVRAFFDILDTESNVKLLSAPQVLVIDNQTANIRVGDQIPVVTRAAQGTSDPDAPVVTEVQYRDTGTLLSVTPRINAGGLVTLEISQEVSTPGNAPAIGGGGNVPISQRTIDSTVMVQSGQTVVLGGLIRENTSNSKSGIPGLMNLPLLGTLFSNTNEDVSRTELIVTVTPRVVENPQAAYQVTEELRRRVKAATAVETSVRH